MKRALMAGTVALAMSAVPAFAQQGSTASKPNTTKQRESTNAAQSAKATSDEHFVMTAAQGGLAEVELGKLATEKASSPEVKQFGQRMVDDHSKVNDELKSLASKKNITVPTTLDAKDQALHDRLSKLSGEAFDRAYMRAMVRDHTKDVKEFRHVSTTAKDADVKAFAANTLPTLEDHLKMAEQNSKAVATSGSSKTRPKATTGSTTTPDAGTTPRR